MKPEEIRLQFFEDRVKDDLDTLARHERELAEERVKYAAARPLTEEERESLARHVEAGGALCCTKGRAWLRERLPEPWADAINGWAYENLGCCPSRPEHAEKVRALKLDRFPCTN